MPTVADTLSEPEPASAPDFDRHFRRAVWISALIFVIASGIIYWDKAADGRSAFIRWRPQVLEFMHGVNVYETKLYPNPPIMPITLYPLMRLSELEGAMTWYYLKAGMFVLSVWFCFKMVRTEKKVIPSWVQGAVLLLALRPALGDLHHANNNLLIMFLIVSCLMAWREGLDVLAGLLLALAICYKVTPALFLPYFMYKRSWRTVGATFLGIGIFLLIVPSLIIGVEFNAECLASWSRKMLGPFLVKGEASPQEVNQSMVGVLTRLLTNTKTGSGRYDVHLDLNIVSWPPLVVSRLIKGISLGLLGMLGFLCRTNTERRDDPRLLGEFSLVVLTMLFVSERSWKHHFVTVLLPYTYLMYRVGVSPVAPRVRWILGSALILSTVLMATTSSELGGLFAHKDGHKIAQGYGMFLWSAVVLYIATAWRVWVESGRASSDDAANAPSRSSSLLDLFPKPLRIAPG